jgi:putative lysine/arginine/ornithine/histidine/octopine transport system ATP-binding protein
VNRQVPVLQLENIHKRYAGLEVLKGIDLTANAGDAISIIGSSGSGKSTLLRCINLLERPNEGRIVLDGEELKLARQRDGAFNAADTRQLDRFRTQLGFVFQSFNLWPHMTILQNVIEAPTQVRKQNKTEAVEQAEALLQKVGLYDKRNAYPVSLSGGQQQRAAIARALAMQPKVILFDEPTSALDPELVGEVLGVIRQLAEEGRTMLIVTHEMRFARDVSSQVVFLHQGRIEEQGTPAEVFDNPRSERCRQFLASTQ